MFVNADGGGVLGDFGLSVPTERFRHLSMESSQRNGNGHTTAPEYMRANDPLEGNKRTPEADMYSYGCLIYDVRDSSLAGFQLLD